MLPRWLTALSRFAATWRDEIIVVAIGLVYQAGIAGPVVTRHEAQNPAEQVIVRIAAPAPEPVFAPVYTVDKGAFVKMNALAKTKTVTKGQYRVNAATVTGARPRVTRVAPVQGSHLPIEVAPVPPVSALPTAASLIAAAGSRAIVVDGRAGTTRVRLLPTRDAGENIAAELALGIEIDTVVLPEIRASVERARAAMDEARVRAAIQKALAAERTRPRAVQGPGA